MIYRFNQKKGGFTLIEILVSVSILVIVLLTTANIIRAISGSQKKISLDSLALNDVNYFLKLASDNIRYAQKSDGSLCQIDNGKFFKIEDSFISFIKDGECYYFESIADGGVNRLVMYTDSKGEKYISSKKTNINNLSFQVEDYLEYGQVLVTILIEASSVEDPDSETVLQTSVSIEHYE